MKELSFFEKQQDKGDIIIMSSAQHVTFITS